MIIAITGRPGSGKTTLLMKVLTKIRGVGFYTKEIREGRRRIGFVAVTSWGEEVLLAKVGIDSPYKVGKYGVLVPQFEEKVVNPLKEMAEKESLIYIDEIGKMELFSKKFVSFLEDLLKVNKNLLITIPAKDVHTVVRKFRQSADLLIDAWKYWDKKEEAARLIIDRLARR